jgi:hypothetical protein
MPRYAKCTKDSSSVCIVRTWLAQSPSRIRHETIGTIGPSIPAMRQDLTNLMDDVLPELLGLQTQKSSVCVCECFFFYFYVFLMISVHCDGVWELKNETWASMTIMLRFPDDDERNRLWFLIFLQLIRRAQGSSFPPVPPGWLIVLFKVPLRSHLAAYSSNMFQYLNHLWTTSIDSNFAWISSKAIGV